MTCPFYAVTGVKRLKKCPEAVDSFLVIWTVCRSIATLDLGDTFMDIIIILYTQAHAVYAEMYTHTFMH
jgi:hypothetical protein